MADPKAKPQARRPRKSTVAVKPSIDFHRKNVYLALIAAGTVILGYILLAAGSRDVSSLLLVVGYLVLFPWAILAK